MVRNVFTSLQIVSRPALRRSFLAGLAIAFTVLLSGCGVDPTGSLPPGAPVASALSGRVHGGQQPVKGAHVYLYALANTPEGAATSLLTTPGGYVVTDDSGNWHISDKYVCPTGAYVYLLSLGGNPGLADGTDNTELALASGLGQCSSLTSSQFFTINEVTTAVTAFAFAPIASTETQAGSASSNDLANAFATISNLSNVNQGSALATTPDGTGTVPQAKINSLADSLAACVNSDGTGNPCSSLMTDAGVTGPATPVDTFQAALQIAQRPANNAGPIFNLATPNAPFEPILPNAPSDWSFTIQYSGGVNATGGVSFNPASATLSQGTQAAFTVTAAGATSFQWATTSNAGTLTETGGSSRTGQTAYCSTSPQASYVSNAAPALTSSATDTITVQTYATSDCSGSMLGSATAAVTTVPPTSGTTAAGVPTTTYTATIVLPPGSHLTPDALTVVDSITQTTPSSSGTFSIPSYSVGEQIVFVDGPDGTPMMAGWMDVNHATVSASTTAEVLAYVALGGASMLTEADRENVITQIPQLSGFPSFANTVATELAANPDAFAHPDAAITSALNQLFTSVTGVTANHSGLGAVHPLDVSISPDAVTPQSGVTLSSTEPPPPYTTSNTLTPFSTFLTNAYRRRTHTFVIAQKDTLNNVDTPNGAQITDFDVTPTVGVNGGVTGALVDIVKAYFGNQPTAYAPVTTDPFDLPVDSGFDSTTYQIINVGPGGSGKPSPVPLTGAQHTILVTTSVNSFVTDFLVPFVNNVLVGSGETGDANNNTPLSGNERSTFVLNVEKNLATVINNLGSGEQDKLVAGDYKGAITDLLFNAGTQSLVSDAITNGFQAAAPSVEDGQFLKKSLDDFNRLLYGAGAGLQVFDTVIYAAQIANSNNVDVWTVKSTQFKATLSPTATTLNGVGNVALQANVLSVSNTTGFSYKFTLTPSTVQSTGATLTGSGGAVPDGDGKLTFCASDPNVIYATNTSAVFNLTQVVTDTISVTVYSKGNCAAASQFTSPTQATITTNAQGTVLLTPDQPTINPGDNVQLTARYSDPKDSPPITPTRWKWNVISTTGGATNGTLTGVDGSGSFCSTSPNATYTSTATYPLTATVKDIVTVNAFTDTACAKGYGLPSSTGTPSFGTSAITTSGSARLRVNSPALIHPGDQVSLTASFRLGLTGNPTPKSYLWTTSGNFGKLTVLDGSGQPQTGQTSFCSIYPQATYVSTPDPTLKQSEADTVNATPFADTNCTSGMDDGLPGSATMNIQPPPGPFVTPGPIAAILQSGDGNFYATTTAAYCGVNSSDICDYILKITPAGIVTTLHTFELGYNATTNPDGEYATSLIEASDGNLYGTAAGGGPSGDGTIFKMDKAGNFTVLYSFDQVFEGVTTGIPRAGHIDCNNVVISANYAQPAGANPGGIIEGADGNFYGLAQGGYSYGFAANGTFFRISPSGAFSLLHTYTYAYSVATPNGFADPCGNPSYTTTSNYVDPIFFTSISGIPPLLQGLDGNFYGEMGAVNGNNGKLFRLDATGGPTVLHSFASDNSEGSVSSGALVAVPPNGSFVGRTYQSAFSITESGDFQLLSTTPPALLGLLGGDGNYYIATGANYTGSINQISPSGNSTLLGPLTNSDPQATVTNGQPSGSQVIAGNGNLAGGALGGDSTTPVSFVFNDPTVGQAASPVQLSFPAGTAHVNQAITLTWNVFNAFSLTAQQCHATVQQPPTGSVTDAGNWTGPQVGSMQENVYTGSAAIVPTAPGTYTYALTCGGNESGFATLTVQ